MRDESTLSREDAAEMDMGHARFAEDVVLTLHVVQPPANTEETLVRRKILLRLRDVDETDGLQEFRAVRFAL